jgi:anti-anti-sigma factor
MEVSRSGDVNVIRLCRRDLVDERMVRMIGDEMLRLEALGHHNIMIDFSEVRQLSSSMLATLVKLQKQALQAGGRLALAGTDQSVYRLFEVTHLSRIFSFYPNTEEALKSFNTT